MLNRRSFIIASGLTALASTRVLGANDTVRVGVIGAGGRMRNLLDAADKLGRYQIVAVSDVYGPHRDAVRERSNGVATTHLDYREVLATDVDAVFIASPDHWHVRMAVDALAAGKDVYLEKPVTHTIEEGATLTRAVRSSKQILQCGMQQRSWTHFRDAVDLIQSGSLGRVPQVRTYWWQNYHRDWAPKPIDTQALDWKLWLGSAPDQPFSEEKYNHWRWFWNFGGGAMTDLFSHWIDVVHWAMKSDQPREAHMLADKYVFEAVGMSRHYPGGLPLSRIDVGYDGMMNSSVDDGGLEFRGTDGNVKAQSQRLLCLSRGRAGRAESGAHREKFPRWHHFTRGEFPGLRQEPQRAQRARGDWGRRRAGWAHRQHGLPSRRPDGMASEGPGPQLSFTGRRPVRESIYCGSERDCRGPAN
jgi:predicted dehydrogenase